MIIWALDAASTTGIAIGDPLSVEPPILSTIKFSRPYDYGDSTVVRAGKWLNTALWEAEKIGAKPGAIWIEKPLPFGVRGRPERAVTPVLLHGLYTAFSVVAELHDVRTRGIAVRTVRALVLGNGNEQSDAAKRHAMKLARCAGCDPQNDNEGDAWAIYEFVRLCHRQKRLEGI